MKRTKTANAHPRRRTVGWWVNKTMRWIIGLLGLLLVATIIIGLGWLLFLCWLWDRKYNPNPLRVRQGSLSGIGTRNGFS